MKTKAPHIPALTRTFAGIERCQQHRGELLTREGTCPRCAREADMARQRTEEEQRDARKAQALARVTAGKRRAA